MGASFRGWERIVLPTTKAIALVEFISSNDAKSAFKGLAYKRFKHVPLYLEWTPEAIFKKEAELDNKPEKVETSSIKEKIETEEIKSSESSTLYVKNLNFKTTEEALRSLCLQHVPESSIRAVTIAKSKKGNKVLSLGFGFIEFSDKAAAVKALKTIQGGELDGHKLMLKFSSSNDKNKGKPTKRKQAVKPSAKATSAKLLVKNLAFEVQKQDLRKLFGPFGQVKVVRIPKKFDGKSRGYGFVEFTTKQEAKNAYEKLTHAHLYGRHLVIEYAKEENSSLESIANKVKENLSKY